MDCKSTIVLLLFENSKSPFANRNEFCVKAFITNGAKSNEPMVFNDSRRDDDVCQWTIIIELSSPNHFSFSKIHRKPHSQTIFPFRFSNKKKRSQIKTGDIYEEKPSSQQNSTHQHLRKIQTIQPVATKKVSHGFRRCFINLL